MFTSLLRAELQEAVFDLADAGGSNFSGANLTKSRWRGSRVFGVEIYNALNQRTGKTVFPRFDGADLTGADLRGAGLEGIDFTGVPLPGANLSGADLRNCTGQIGSAPCLERGGPHV